MESQEPNELYHPAMVFALVSTWVFCCVEGAGRRVQTFTGLIPRWSRQTKVIAVHDRRWPSAA